MTLEEVQNKLQEILDKLSGEEEISEEELGELEKQAEGLEEEKKSLIAKAEKRSDTLRKVASINNIEVKEEVPVEEKKEEKMENVNYRSAYFKKIMGKELSEEERALTTSTTAVIPEETSNTIFEKMVKLVPLLNEIELFHVKGNLKFAVETTRADAGQHTENSTDVNVDSTAVLTEVSLGGYEFTKLIQISSAMLNQSIDAFEAWLTDMLANSIATLVEDKIINGTGSSTVKGVNAITYIDATNAVAFNGSTGLTAGEVREAIGYLPASYDANGKFLMNKKTLFNQFMGLQDNAKCDIVRVEGNQYFVYGYPVIISDKVATNVAFLGDFKKYVGNMSSDIEVKNAYDIDTNSYKYAGVCIFDGKPAVEEAFVKIATSL